MNNWVTVTGLLLNLIGVLLLFRYGMPFRVSVGEGELITTQGMPDAEKKLDSRYKCLGYVGLFAIVLGTIMQILPLIGEY